MKQTNEYFSEYRKKNPERMKSIHAKYRKNNLEKVRERQNAWGKKNYAKKKIEKENGTI